MRDPVAFLEGALGLRLWEGQKAIVRSVQASRRTAVKSGHNVGKTFIAAAIVLEFLYANRGSKVVTTATTWSQVENLLWSEIRKIHAQAPFRLGPPPLQTKIEIEPGWHAVGMSTKDPSSFQGTHSGRILIVFDEAQGIPSPIWDAAETMMSSHGARWLAIGNPISPSGRFHEAFQRQREWNCITLPCLAHPNVVEGQLVYIDAVTKEWVEEKRRVWGEGSPLWKVRVLGEFPENAQNVLVTVGMLEAAQEATVAIEERHLGLDVARFGSDENVCVLVKNRRVEAVRSWGGQDTMQTVGQLRAFADEWRVEPQNWHIDVIGVGAGVVDRCREQGLRVDGVTASASPRGDWRQLTGTTKFRNRRAELYWVVRELIARKELAIPREHEDVWHELSSTRFSYDSQERVQIEAKEDLKQRVGRSPDHADALALAMSRSSFVMPRIWAF
jgi:hypothetical protein